MHAVLGHWAPYRVRMSPSGSHPSATGFLLEMKPRNKVDGLVMRLPSFPNFACARRLAIAARQWCDADGSTRIITIMSGSVLGAIAAPMFLSPPAFRWGIAATVRPFVLIVRPDVQTLGRRELGREAVLRRSVADHVEDRGGGGFQPIDIVSDALEYEQRRSRHQPVDREVRGGRSNQQWTP